MAKKKTLTMWALWNYGRVMDVGFRRRDCRDAANNLVVGGKVEADKMFANGAFRFTKVNITEA